MACCCAAAWPVSIVPACSRRIDERQVQIQDTVRPGVADINIRPDRAQARRMEFLRPAAAERFHQCAAARVGTAGCSSFPAYAVSFNLLAYSSILKLTTARRLLPVLALERPFTPGAGWLSGFAFTPQIPTKLAGANYLYTQFDRRIQPLLAGQRGPDLTGDLPASRGRRSVDR